jgi:glutamate/tyrosine decarboxylase-like PLP-dependent enzyme
MNKVALIAAVAVVALIASCGQASAPAAQEAQREIYIHVDPATGCHYIVFPDGSGVVRTRPDGMPYCDAAQPAPAPTP